nr:hypothetical protein [uncultured Methanoregula sp.]
MTAIPRKYITDARNQKQAVIVDLETFNQMESIIENNGLAKCMEEAESDETFVRARSKEALPVIKKGLKADSPGSNVIYSYITENSAWPRTRKRFILPSSIPS